MSRLKTKNATNETVEVQAMENVETGSEVSVSSAKKSQAYLALEALIADYKAQNPIKYQAKKDSLEKQLAKLA